MGSQKEAKLRQVSVDLFLWFTQHAYKGIPITRSSQNEAESDFTASIGFIEHLSEDSSTCGEKLSAYLESFLNPGNISLLQRKMADHINSSTTVTKKKF
jgi:hypothetical protein